MIPDCSTGPERTEREWDRRNRDRCVDRATTRERPAGWCRIPSHVARETGPVCQRLHDYTTEAEMFARLAGVWGGR